MAEGTTLAALVVVVMMSIALLLAVLVLVVVVVLPVALLLPVAFCWRDMMVVVVALCLPTLRLRRPTLRRLRRPTLRRRTCRVQ